MWTDTYSVALNGVDQSVDFGNVLNIDRVSPTSISFWLYFSAYYAQPDIYPLAKADSGNAFRGWFINVNGANGFLSFYLVHTYPSNMILKQYSVLSPGWSHVVFTYDGSGLAAGVLTYINGNLVSTSTTSDSLTGTTVGSSSFTVNGIPGYRVGYLNGNLDEVSFFDRVLSAGDVSTIYNGGTPTDIGSMANLISWYRFENDFLDSAGSNDGSGINGPTFSTSVP